MVEGARLERVYTGNRIEGSNPSPSASSHLSEILYSVGAGAKSAGKGVSFSLNLLTIGTLNTRRLFSDRLPFSIPDDFAEKVRIRTLLELQRFCLRNRSVISKPSRWASGFPTSTSAVSLE